jgi:hypothetical protein
MLEDERYAGRREGHGMDFDSANKSCSFCGMRGTSETRFAGGLGAMMCVDCLEFYHHKFSSPELLETISRPPWEKMSDTEILAKLPLIADTATQVNGFLGEWVQMARERNLSWAEIGQALGVSRQAAWERFAGSKTRKSDGATA